MATGTSGGLLTRLDENAQSLYKHELLSHYLATFASMTGSTARGKRVVVLDGFAGRGRYPDGQPGSAERILQAMLSQKTFRDIDAFFVEKNPSDYAILEGVVAEYVAQGVDGIALPKRVEDHLDRVIAHADGVPLFLFLDPCGVGVSFDRLVGVLTGPRVGRRPATEALLNFSAEMSRRVSGAVLANTQAEQRAMDNFCGGTWWRDVAREAIASAPRDASGKPSFEPVTHAIAEQYAQRLAEVAGMASATVPVYRRLGQQPVYHLVFFTRSPYGLWVFADASARARRAWLRHLGKIADAPGDPVLFTDTELKEDLIRKEQERARTIVADAIRRLLERFPGFRLVNRTVEVFGAAYGVATEDIVRQAVLELHAAGQLRLGQGHRGVRTRELVVARPSPRPEPPAVSQSRR